jgi:hypothetical protein
MTDYKCLNTLTHLATLESLNNFRLLQKKWPRWRLEESCHKLLDLSECQFMGQGGHEIAVFTFARHQMLAHLSGAATYPIWVSVGPHWSDDWHDMNGVPNEDVPLIGIVRGISDTAGFIEPFRVLAVVSCTNGQFVFDEIMKRLPEHLNDKPSSSRFSGNPRCRRLRSSLEAFLSVARGVLRLPCPPVPPIAPRLDCAVSISYDDLVQGARERTDFVWAKCTPIGSGPHIVYAYTYDAIAEVALLTAEMFYPLKVGWTSFRAEGQPPERDAITRVTGQIPFREPAQILGILQCTGGRKVESKIHTSLKDRRIRCIGKEWFLSNKEEVEGLLASYMV